MDYQKFKQAKAIDKKPYKKDLTGKRFGRLVVVGYYGKKTCGNQKNQRGFVIVIVETKQ